MRTARDNFWLDAPYQPGGSLGGEHEADVAIVGGGFTGMAAAYFIKRRFPEKRLTIDGLVVKVRDTDPGPDADLDAYLGRKRIGRGEDLRVGDALPAWGHSGRNYDIVLLAIIDSTETVRFAIRPAR